MALQYISHADETERRARILRVQQSIEEDKNKTPTVLAKISHEVNKEKGHVFSYDMPHSEGFPLVGKPSRHAVSARSGDHTRASQAGSSSGESNNSHSVPMGPTVFSAGALAPRLEGPPGFPPLFPELQGEERAMALQYISLADETERRARILRVQQSIEEDKNKTPTVLAKISHDVNKEKGHVFSYDMPHSEGFPLVGKPSRHALSARSGDHTCASQAGSSSGESNNFHLVPIGPTVFSVGALGFTSTGILRNKKKSRQRPPTWVRHVRPNQSVTHKDQVVSDKLEGDSGPPKRKAEETELSQAGIEEAIARGWEGDPSQALSSVMDRLSRCRSELSRWKKRVHFNSQSKIQKLHIDLEKEIAKT
ncbi:hypothetical protein F2Q70_00020133 [Brassica cretica]|uniref:Uncharacterized protein n=1 Tax=Brassica cretica TaxID=69181 RepID=A0A8S9GM18_BRACR|nr:hypothetical protein F2Q70_00020133 [Brassica cretica]